MVGTKSQYFMLSQHCAEGGDKKSVFYAESALRKVEGVRKVMVGTKSQYFMLSQHCTEGARKVMVGTKSQYFMLSQHCTEGAGGVRRCAEGDGGDKKSVFYAESALHGRCVGGARKVMVGTKSQYFMLSQHCTEGAREVRGR